MAIADCRCFVAPRRSGRVRLYSERAGSSASSATEGFICIKRLCLGRQGPKGADTRAPAGRRPARTSSPPLRRDFADAKPRSSARRTTAAPGQRPSCGLWKTGPAIDPKDREKRLVPRTHRLGGIGADLHMGREPMGRLIPCTGSSEPGSASRAPASKEQQKPEGIVRVRGGPAPLQPINGVLAGQKPAKNTRRWLKNTDLSRKIIDWLVVTSRSKDHGRTTRSTAEAKRFFPGTQKRFESGAEASGGVAF